MGLHRVKGLCLTRFGVFRAFSCVFLKGLGFTLFGVWVLSAWGLECLEFGVWGLGVRWRAQVWGFRPSGALGKPWVPFYP